MNLRNVNFSSLQDTANKNVKTLPVLARTVEDVMDVYAKLALYVQLARNQMGAILTAARMWSKFVHFIAGGASGGPKSGSTGSSMPSCSS
jgi:hypothetical protein